MLRHNLSPTDELERQLQHARISGFERERLLIPGRKFRADFAWPAELLVVEVDGGTFARQGAKRCLLCGHIPTGRHTTGMGRARDCEKQALAVLNGWRYLTVTTQQVREEIALGWIQQALGRR